MKLSIAAGRKAVLELFCSMLNAHLEANLEKGHRRQTTAEGPRARFDGCRISQQC